MALRDSQDVLADFVVDKVPANVRATFSEEQLKAVRSAAHNRHSVDLRFTVPLLFTRLYVVFLVGKDTRRSTLAEDSDRRARAGLHASSFAIGVIAALAVVATAVTLYVLKSKAGIDLFPGHVDDFVPMAK